MIGSHVAAYYREEGNEVCVMDNLERSALLGHEVSAERMFFNKKRLRAMGVYVLPLDVSKSEHWEVFDHDKFDLIVHLAAQCGVPTSIARPRRDFEVNAMGTINALEKAKADDSIFVYASTNKVYPIHGGWMLEDDKWRWVNKEHHDFGWPVAMPPEPIALNKSEDSRTPYGTSKYLGDLYCQEYAEYYGLRTGVFRMSCIYGDHQFGFEEQGWAAWFTLANLKGWPIKIFGDGKQVRDMLYVTDAVAAYDSFVKAVRNRDIKSGVWNLGGGVDNTMSVNECIQQLFVETGESSKVFMQDWRPSDQRVYTSDIRPIEADLGWVPTINCEDGMRTMIEWFQQHLDLF